mmetsp:Transcript_28094/g.66379  ORF Transcript_28094/g.66379 Transcript_28094/m.66379 type:complete len:230 (+) Transcript_28094:130-819(+)
MDPSRAGRQIQQLVDFIKLEAREKATEIRVKTEHDFNLERQKMVTAARRKLETEFARREKELEMAHRIETSKSVGGQRARKFTARDEYMTKLAGEARERLAAFSAQPQYAELLESLIVQGIGRLEDTEVEVMGRAADAALLAKAAAAAQSRVEGSTVTVSSTHLDPRSAGGVRVTALKGRIVCDNTLEARLELALHDLQPVVRYMLFPSCRAEDRKAAGGAAAEEDLMS